SASTAAGTGGLGQMLGGAGLVQTAVSFLIGAAVGAGGYATLQGDGPEPSPDRQVVPATADADSGLDATADTGLSDAGGPDTSHDTSTDTSPDAGDAADGMSADTAPSHHPEKASEPSVPDPSDDAPAEPAPDPSPTSHDAGESPDTARPHADTASTLSDERVVLSTAQSALARGRPKEALAALGEHEKRFPNGQLVEERRALTIRALMQTGRDDEARRKARKFLKDYPNSIFRKSVEPALGEQGD
ncbi:MAG: hypothetical protein ABEN55_10005, partial [Bradymonadaceae bacterium]